jgi:hypothetical protein
MTSNSAKGGLEELLRLSKAIAKTGQERSQLQRERAKEKQKVADLRQGLKEINTSVALQQLKGMAKPEIIKKVSSLRHEKSTRNLRNLILDLSAELERWVDRTSDSTPNMVSMKRSVKTLAILIELLFSLE